jgi:hypothetical protein
MPAATPQTECLICHLSVRWRAESGRNSYDCPRCGSYALPTPSDWDPVQPAQRVRISGWIRRQNAMGDVPLITLDTLRRVRTIAIPNLRERANQLLIALVKRYPRFNDTFVVPTLSDDLELQEKPIPSISVTFTICSLY